MKKQILILMILSFGFSSHSGEILQVPAEDDQFKYYLGMGEEMTSLQEALNASFRNAADSAIRENFGFQSSIERTSFENSKDSQIRVIHHEKSDLVRLEGFEKVSTQIIQNQATQKYTVKTIYKYPKANIKNEMLRLQATSTIKTEFSEVGEVKMGLSSLEIETEPTGAYLFIDGVPFPNTPVRVLGQISPGTHRIFVDHPFSESYEEELQFNPNTKISKKVILKPGISKLTVDSNVPQTEVFINGQKVGETPVLEYGVPAGKAFSLELKRKDVYPILLPKMVLSKGSQDLGIMDLKYRPGHLSLSSLPREADVEINGVLQKRSERRFQLQPGPSIVRLSHPDYEVQEISIAIRPLETIHQTASMKRLDEAQKQKRMIEAEERKYEAARKQRQEFFQEVFYFNVLGQMEFNGSPLKDIKSDLLCGNLELHTGLRRWLGGSLALKYGAGGESESGYDEFTVTSLKGLKLGLWLHLYQKQHDSISIGYESEDSELELTKTASLTQKKTYQTVKIQGKGPAFLWNTGIRNGGIFSVQIGTKKMVSETPTFTGKQQTYISLGLGYDFLGP